MKHFKCFLNLLICSLILCGCSGNRILKIGILQYDSFPAAEQCLKGFKEGLEKAGYVEGQNIFIEYQNAHGSKSECVAAAQKLINEKCTLIFTLSTPAAEIISNLTSTIPVLFSLVTNTSAAMLVDPDENLYDNLSGILSANPVSDQLSLIKKILPDSKTIGLLYCSEEKNSVFQIKQAKSFCNQNLIRYQEASVRKSEEIQDTVRKLSKQCDVIYIPADNLLARNMRLVTIIADEGKIPVFASDLGLIDSGAFAAYSTDFYDIGKEASEMALTIIEENTDIKKMPVRELEFYSFKYNKNLAQTFGITVPDGLFE